MCVRQKRLVVLQIRTHVVILPTRPKRVGRIRLIEGYCSIRKKGTDTCDIDRGCESWYVITRVNSKCFFIIESIYGGKLAHLLYRKLRVNIPHITVEIMMSMWSNSRRGTPMRSTRNTARTSKTMEKVDTLGAAGVDPF